MEFVTFWAELNAALAVLSRAPATYPQAWGMFNTERNPENAALIVGFIQDRSQLQ